MNAPNDFHDDPRLTAYALNELDGAERAEVDALLAKDETARRAVEEIRATAGTLAAELGREPASSLTELQRTRIAAVAKSGSRPKPVLRTFRIGPVASIAAASLLVGATGGVLVGQRWAARTDQSTLAQREGRDFSGDGSFRYRGNAEFARREGLYDSDGSTAATDQPVPGVANATFTAAGGSGAAGELKPTSSTSLTKDTFAAHDGGRGGVGDQAATGSAYSMGGGAGGGGARTSGGAGAPNPDPDAPINLPSGATGGTSVGVGGGPRGPAPGGKRGAGSSGGFGKRAGGGKGEGGLIPPPAPPKPARPRGYTGPGAETPPASREPSDAPPPPEGSGPSTPGGGGPATGGPDAAGGKALAAQPKAPVLGDVPVAGTLIVAKQEEAEQLKKLQALGYVGGPTVDDHTYPGSWSSTAAYAHVEDNPFRLVKDAPLSTFGVDVDTGSYSNIRRFLSSRQLPPPGAVRIEEMVNYFPYDYAPPQDGRPFAVRVDVAGCPWKTDHRLVRVGIKGKVVATAARPAANLVFLLDVSGSMSPANRLPLVVQSMKLLLSQLEARDRVAIVVYAGASGLVLPSTACEDKATILAALDSLRSGGSTNGAAGIELAYQVAAQNKIEGGVNRVILATDGDFNVGVTDQSSLVTMIQEKAKQGTFLSVLGVGDDNLKDSTMEMLADKGNGNYAYIDTIKEGEKALVAQASGTLVTIAKDVKLQIEFNPSQVGAYRLIGYENRVLAAEDFKDDKKDAGEIGAGHTVTALYEIATPGTSDTLTAGVEPLKYQTPPAPAGDISRELLTVKLRWKEPNADVSTPMEVPVVDEGMTYSSASPDFKFAASVAAFGMTLRNSPHRGNVSMSAILELATEGAANDPGGYRAEFVTMLKQAVELGLK